ncbi:MAG: MFS transporter [Synechococcales bacterium]|nr:MFS transporter [Synechococcales bacterium]
MVKPFSWFAANLPRPIWILALGRLLSQIGTGFTMFYAPIFFVNQLGLSATIVGIGLGAGAISGVLGRFLGGAMADDPSLGRRKALLLSAVISAIAAFGLASSINFTTFLLGTLLANLGSGIYWPVTEAVVADVVKSDQRTAAYSVVRFADNVGLGLGVVLGGWLITVFQAYRALFMVDGISFLVFFVVIYLAIPETQPAECRKLHWQGWQQALSDRALLLYVSINTCFTAWIAQIQSTIPLYFSNFIHPGAIPKGFDAQFLSFLFSLFLGISILVQFPLSRQLQRFRHVQVLMLSASLWIVGFACVWGTAALSAQAKWWAMVAMGILAIATTVYLPVASALVADFAPESLRGVYAAINSQCWALGYLIAPPIGGWALDHSPAMAHQLWGGLILSVILVMGLLQGLDRLVIHRTIQD